MNVMSTVAPCRERGVWRLRGLQFLRFALPDDARINPSDEVSPTISDSPAHLDVRQVIPARHAPDGERLRFDAEKFRRLIFGEKLII